MKTILKTGLLLICFSFMMSSCEILDELLNNKEDDTEQPEDKKDEKDDKDNKDDNAIPDGLSANQFKVGKDVYAVKPYWSDATKTYAANVEGDYYKSCNISTGTQNPVAGTYKVVQYPIAAGYDYAPGANEVALKVSLDLMSFSGYTLKPNTGTCKIDVDDDSGAFSMAVSGVELEDGTKVSAYYVIGSEDRYIFIDSRKLKIIEDQSKLTGPSNGVYKALIRIVDTNSSWTVEFYIHAKDFKDGTYQSATFTDYSNVKENEFSAIAADQYDKKIYESNGTGTLTIKDKKIIFKDVEVLYNGTKKTLRGAYQFE